MKLQYQKWEKVQKWAIFGLFFSSSVLAASLFIRQAHAAFTEPAAPPPEDNTPAFLNIGDATQVKQGALRLGTNDETSPYNYQLEVVGSGAALSNAVVDSNLKVSAVGATCVTSACAAPAYCSYGVCRTDTLYVDSQNSRACVGPYCLAVAGTKLEVSGGTTSITGVGSTGLSAVSSDSVAIRGTGTTYGVQGVATGSTNAGIMAISALWTALEGYNIPNTYSAVYGTTASGFGVYGANANPQGLWAGYFSGRVESSRTISAAKFESTTAQPSLVPFTAGQETGYYFRGYTPLRITSDGSDGTSLWVGQSGTLVDGTWFGSEVLQVDKVSGVAKRTYPGLGFTSDLIYDSAAYVVWQARGDYPGGISRININSGVAERRSVLNLSDNWGTCPMGYIVRGSGTNLWAIRPGGSCYGRDYPDQLLRFDTSTFTANATQWVPSQQLSFDHGTQNPTAIVYDGTSLWVSFKDSGVYKLSEASLIAKAAEATLAVTTDYSVLAVPSPTDLANDPNNGVVWVSADGSGTGSDGAYSINRATGAVSGRVVTYTGDPGGFYGPQAIAYYRISAAEEYVLVGTNSGTTTGYVDKFDANLGITGPATVPIAHFPTSSGPTIRDIFYDSAQRAVWVPSADSHTITKLDAATGSQRALFSYGVSNLSVKRYDGTNLWVADGSYLRKVRAEDGFTVFRQSLGSGSARATDVLYDANSVWVAVSGDNLVTKMNPYTGATICSVGVANPKSIIFDGQYYWVTGTGTGGVGTVTKISSSCTASTPITVTTASYTLGKLLFNGSHLWALATENATGAGSVININPGTSQAVRWDGVIGSSPTDILYDNYFYWVSNGGNGTLTRFYLLDAKVCSVKNGDQLISCQADSDCVGFGGCFALPQSFGTYDVNSATTTSGGTHETDQPLHLAFDGSSVWVTNH
ncbi:MAG: hypothetical protein V1916_00795, partial [Patescibacteria group bacterium]